MSAVRRLAWVIGRGGLLGSALERALQHSGVALHVPDERFAWQEPDRLPDQMRRAVTRFAAAASTAGVWEIHWAAGVGTMGSTDESLRVETRALDALLAALDDADLRSGGGRVSFASSAGAIYAGSSDPVIDEFTTERPTTPYAHAKLANERRVHDWAKGSGSALLIARISTLYGVGQASDKQQGLLTHIARCVIRNQPIRIFVPLDTIRDYVAADEAATSVLEALEQVGPGRTTIKIVASEQPATISEILSLFRRIARRSPRIVTSGSPLSNSYVRRVQFRSVVPPLRSRPPMNLLIGISQVLTAERLRYTTAERSAVP